MSSSITNAPAAALEPSEDEDGVEAQLRAWQAEMRAERLRRLAHTTKAVEARARRARHTQSPPTPISLTEPAGQQRASRPARGRATRRPSEDVAGHKKDLDAVSLPLDRREVQARHERLQDSRGDFAHIDPNEVEFHVARGLLHDYIRGKVSASSLTRRQRRGKASQPADTGSVHGQRRSTRPMSGTVSHGTSRAASTQGERVTSRAQSGQGGTGLPHSIAVRAAESRDRTRSAAPDADKIVEPHRTANRSGRPAQPVHAAPSRTASWYQHLTQPRQTPSTRPMVTGSARPWQQTAGRTLSSASNAQRGGTDQHKVAPPRDVTLAAAGPIFRPRLRYGRNAGVTIPSPVVTGATDVADSAPLQRHVWPTSRQPVPTPPSKVTQMGQPASVIQDVVEPPGARTWRSHYRDVVALLATPPATRGSPSLFARRATAQPQASDESERDAGSDVHAAAVIVVASEGRVADDADAATAPSMRQSRWRQPATPRTVVTGVDCARKKVTQRPVTGLLFDRLIATRGGTAAYDMPLFHGDVVSSVDSSAASRDASESSRH